MNCVLHRIKLLMSDLNAIADTERYFKGSGMKFTSEGTRQEWVLSHHQITATLHRRINNYENPQSALLHIFDQQGSYKRSLYYQLLLLTKCFVYSLVILEKRWPRWPVAIGSSVTWMQPERH